MTPRLPLCLTPGLTLRLTLPVRLTLRLTLRLPLPLRSVLALAFVLPLSLVLRLPLPCRLSAPLLPGGLPAAFGATPGLLQEAGLGTGFLQHGLHLPLDALGFLQNGLQLLQVGLQLLGQFLLRGVKGRQDLGGRVAVHVRRRARLP